MTVSLVQYLADFFDWTKYKLEEMNRKSWKLFTIQEALPPLNDANWLKSRVVKKVWKIEKPSNEEKKGEKIIISKRKVLHGQVLNLTNGVVSE